WNEGWTPPRGCLPPSCTSTCIHRQRSTPREPSTCLERQVLAIPQACTRSCQGSGTCRADSPKRRRCSTAPSKEVGSLVRHRVLPATCSIGPPSPSLPATSQALWRWLRRRPVLANGSGEGASPPSRLLGA